MSLTQTQQMQCREYMGYSVTGGPLYQTFRELVYSDVSYMGIELDDPTNAALGRLDNLSVPEEARITNYYLPNLVAREQEIQDASANIDTDPAAIWTHNKTEVGERRAMFTALRIDLCRFLGFSPGPGVMNSSRLSRS